MICSPTFTMTALWSPSTWPSCNSTPISCAKVGALTRFKPFFVWPVNMPTRTAVCMNFLSCMAFPTVRLWITVFSLLLRKRPANWPNFFDNSIQGSFSVVIAADKTGAFTIPVTAYSVDLPDKAKNCCAISTATRCWASSVLAPIIE